MIIEEDNKEEEDDDDVSNHYNYENIEKQFGLS